MNLYPHSSRKSGFTLVELLVATGIFAVVMTLAAGAYLVMVGIGARAEATAVASDNLSFVFENVTRSIRTGTNYSCGGCSASGGTSSSFSFKDVSGQNITYSLVRASGSVNGYILETVNGSSFPLTDPSVNVSTLTFYLTGAADTSAGDYLQPYVRMTVVGSANAGHGQTFSFSIETSAAMRGIDI